MRCKKRLTELKRKLHSGELTEDELFDPGQLKTDYPEILKELVDRKFRGSWKWPRMLSFWAFIIYLWYIIHMWARNSKYFTASRPGSRFNGDFIPMHSDGYYGQWVPEDDPHEIPFWSRN